MKVGEYCMTFVTVCADRAQMTSLCHVLVTVFPGCTIHQNRDPMRAVQRLSLQEVDAVFADEDTIFNMLDMVKKHRMTTKIWLLSRQGAALPEEIAGCYGVLSCPVTEHKMRTALQRMPQGS